MKMRLKNDSKMYFKKKKTQSKDVLVICHIWLSVSSYSFISNLSQVVIINLSIFQYFITILKN